MKTGGMLYHSAIAGNRNITPQEVLEDPASSSVITVRTLFAEKAFDIFIKSPEFEVQREELLKYVNGLIESRVGKTSISPQSLESQLLKVLEGQHLDSLPGAANFAGEPRLMAGRRAALNAVNQATPGTRFAFPVDARTHCFYAAKASAETILPGSLTFSQDINVSKGIWSLVDATTKKPGAWEKMLATAMASFDPPGASSSI